MNYPLLISTVSVIISACAIDITWLNYRVNRKMPNENKLFEERFKSYRSVITVFNTTAAIYIECGNEFYDLKGAAQTIRKAKEERRIS